MSGVRRQTRHKTRNSIAQPVTPNPSLNRIRHGRRSKPGVWVSYQVHVQG